MQHMCHLTHSSLNLHGPCVLVPAIVQQHNWPLGCRLLCHMTWLQLIGMIWLRWGTAIQRDPIWLPVKICILMTWMYFQRGITAGGCLLSFCKEAGLQRCPLLWHFGIFMLPNNFGCLRKVEECFHLCSNILGSLEKSQSSKNVGARWKLYMGNCKSWK